MTELFCRKIVDEIGKTERKMLHSLLDHSRFKKSDVNYDKAKGKLVIKLRRHRENSKGRKRILGLRVWDNRIPPTVDCLLTIKDIEHCNIRDEDPQNPQRLEIISGGLVFSNKEIYIGSFCDHENPYGIELDVKRINITLEDVLK